MRWDGRDLAVEDVGALPGLGMLSGLVRSVRTPEFAGITFHEVLCRSALNKVPDASPMPFRWTINPYRGCSHACVYCFARGTHTYLDLDAGHDFDTQIVVKTNLAQVLRRELAGPRWRREHVAMGTNTDPYQRAEGRYRLMPGVIGALADSGTPFSILTKGTVLGRDLPVLSAAARSVPVGIGVSLALLDPQLHAVLEPGTPTPRARLELIRRIRAAGLPCGVLVGPVLPHLTDSPDQLGALVRELRDAGATGVSAIPLHLRPGAREWFFAWLADHRPDLVPVYQQLYARGSTLPPARRRDITERVRAACRDVGVGPFDGGRIRGVPGDADAAYPEGSLPARRRPEAAPAAGPAARASPATLF